MLRGDGRGLCTFECFVTDDQRTQYGGANDRRGHGVASQVLELVSSFSRQNKAVNRKSLQG